jgi:hypothetical protein
MAGKVIDLSIGAVNLTIGFTRVEQNYTNLSAVGGTAIGELAYVVNSEGTAWLPGTLGGSYYPAGIYVWDGANWVSDRNSIAQQLQINIDDIDQLEADVATKIGDAPNDGQEYVRKNQTWVVNSGQPNRNIKAGKVLQVSFTGNPKKSSAITFTTPFPSADYSIALSAHTQNNTTFSIDYEDRTANGFVINTHANNVSNLIDVTWIATEIGE